MRDERAPLPAYRDDREQRVGAPARGSWGPPPGHAVRDSWGPPPTRDDRRAPPPPNGGWGDRGDEWGGRGRGPPPRDAREQWGPPPPRADERERHESWGPPPPRSYDDYAPPPAYYDDRSRPYVDDRAPPPRAYYDDRDRDYYRERSPPRGDYYDRRPPPREYEAPRGPPPPRDDPRDSGAAGGPKVINTNGNNGLVVGPKGANVRRIEEETGARVNCLSDKTTVEISGAPDAVRRASDMIADLLASKDRGGGMGGDDLRARLGGKRSRDDDRQGGADKRPRDSLLENLRQAARDAGIARSYAPEYVDTSRADEQGNVVQSVDITNYIGLVIGKHGRMQAEIQAIVDIPMNINREEGTASFKGPADRVGQGLALVREVIETTNAMNDIRGREPHVRRDDDRRDDRRDAPRAPRSADRPDRPERVEQRRESDVEETLPITGHVGMIIGKQGVNIKWMKRESRCSIEVDREAETVTVRGAPADLNIAKRFIAETLDKANKRALGVETNKQRMTDQAAEFSGDEEMMTRGEDGEL